MSHYVSQGGTTRRRRKLYIGVAAVLLALLVGVAIRALAAGSDGGPAQQSPAAQGTGPVKQPSTPAPAPTASTTGAAGNTAPPASTPTPTYPHVTSTKPPTNTRIYVPRKPTSPLPTNAAGQPYRLATYVVKRGDNLTKIARWFSYNGYGQLFRQNHSKVSNPDLIFPGQVLTVWSSGGMTVGS